MKHPGFYQKAGPFSLGDVVQTCGGTLGEGADPDQMIDEVRPLDEAGEGHVSFINNPKYADQLLETKASACFVSEKFKDKIPNGTAVIMTDQPYHCYARTLLLFYPDTVRPITYGPYSCAIGDPLVHPTATLEEDVIIEPGAVVGPEAAIGRGTRVAGGAFVGYRVHIGRDCYIGPNSVLTQCLVGDRVIFQAGVTAGQDGFGFAMGPEGHLKVPQIGRVIVQDDVEIGANSTIDRGAIKDTIIGEGTKIDNLVQIGHNVVMGRNCVIVSQTGIAGSAELEDFVVMGGQSGAVGHVKIGAGAQIAGGSHVRKDIPPGTRWAGTPAVPMTQWIRELTAVSRLVKQRHKQQDK